MRSWEAFCPCAQAGDAVAATKAPARVWRSHDSLAAVLSRGCRAMDACDLSPIELAAALRHPELTPLAARGPVLKRADAVADAVNPFALLPDDRARAVAAAAGEMLSRGA